MICRYTTTFDDFIAAQNLHMRQGKFGSLGRAFWVWILPALGVIAAMALIYDTTVRKFAFPATVGGVLAGVAWFGLFALVMRPINLRRCYKQMKNGRAETDPLEFEMSGDELVSRIPGQSEGRFRRSAVAKFIEDDKVAMIYVAKKRFLLIPKNAMSPGEWDEVRRWLNSEETSA